MSTSPAPVKGLVCLRCGRTESPESAGYVCADCGVDGILDVDLDLSAAPRKPEMSGPADSLFRYGGFLPVAPPAGGGLPAMPSSPLVAARRAGAAAGLAGLFLKDETRNPTGSLKDRATVVGVSLALSRGERVVTAASTGNAACSLAGFAARLGIRAVIFLPARAPSGKIAQLLVFGAEVNAVEGTYDQAFDLCVEASRRFGWYNRSCAYNPYLVEGKKTVSFEIAEQFGWRAPDWVVVPVGDGCTIGAVGKGFAQLCEVGWIDRVPRLLAVQSTECPPIVEAFRNDSAVRHVVSRTLADGIACGVPRNHRRALRALEESGGSGVVVSDEEILAAVRDLAALEGIFAEPAGAAAFAGLRRALAEGIVEKEETVVALVTGSGLKDPNAASPLLGQPRRLRPVPEALDALSKD